MENTFLEVLRMLQEGPGVWLGVVMLGPVHAQEGARGLLRSWLVPEAVCLHNTSTLGKLQDPCLLHEDLCQGLWSRREHVLSVSASIYADVFLPCTQAASSASDKCYHPSIVWVQIHIPWGFGYPSRYFNYLFIIYHVAYWCSNLFCVLVLGMIEQKEASQAFFFFL